MPQHYLEFTPPLKIALICDWYHPRLGGIETHLGDLARQLSAQGHEVQVITSTPGEAPGKALEEDEEFGLRLHRLQTPLCPKFGVAISPRAISRIKEITVQENYDIVHAHISLVAPVGWAGAYWGQKLGLPTVMTFHSRLAWFAKVLGGLDGLLHWRRWPVVFSSVSRVLAAEVQ
ncbi:MAG: glycosyltransferase, partial [Deltaproteobacteria bacterium]|nr:glycosyltransferase [Deltaproteobacteria bacterium]